MMGPMARKIVTAARANPEWGFDQIADHCCCKRSSVKVVLCAARRAQLIGPRPGDGRPGVRQAWIWIPTERLADYRALRIKVGAAEAQRMIKDDMLRYPGAVKVGADNAPRKT